MKQRLKFYVVGLLFVICNTIVIGEHLHIQSQEKESSCLYISRQQVNQRAISFLFYIYSHTPKEVAANINIQSPHLNNNIRIPLWAIDLRNSFQTIFFSNNHGHTYYHPIPVEYYVFALQKIIT